MLVTAAKSATSGSRLASSQKLPQRWGLKAARGGRSASQVIIARAGDSRMSRTSSCRTPLERRQNAAVAQQKARNESFKPCLAASDSPSTSSGGINWKLTTYFVLWYAFNIIFNILNKSTLNIFPKPWLLSTIQLGAGVLWMIGMWTFKLQPVPKVSKKLIIDLAPVALFHTIAHVSACVSFSKMAVSFTHVIKAAEPVFSVLLTSVFMGETFSSATYLSLIPIVGGCSLAAMKEISFAWGGLNYALVSNLGSVLRNVFSKKRLNEYDYIDGINMYALISIISLCYLAPVAFFVEGSTWGAGWAAAASSMSGNMAFVKLLALGGVFYHLYNQVSYQALTGISPLTFSVGNTMKRVAVIVSSVLFFKNYVSPLNWVGTGLAVLGAYMYSNAKIKKSSS